MDLYRIILTLMEDLMIGKCTHLHCKSKRFLGKTTGFYDVLYWFLKGMNELLNRIYSLIGETTRFYAFEMLIS
jgi:hypothetical protein